MGDYIMLTRIIVSYYSMLVEISIWVVLFGSLISFWKMTGSFFGAIIGSAVIFALLAVNIGGFLMIDDIRKTLNRLEKQKRKN